MVFFPNQYAAYSNSDTLQRREAMRPQMSSIDSNTPVNMLQFLQPSQMASSASLLAFVKENNATLNFPQKLMLLLSYVDNERDRGNHITCISWVRDGHAFVIKDRQELVDSLLPLFFREGKFSSFTRKLYRWGFRQICIPKGGTKKDRDLMFGHEDFQRDNKSLMTEMRSVTAAGTRRAITALTSKKKAKKNKDKDATQKPSPVFIPAPAAPTQKVENTINLERFSPTEELKPQNLVQVHLERLLGGSYNPAKPATAKPQSPPIQTPSLVQNSTQSALGALLGETNKSEELKSQSLVQAHLERLLGGSNTSATKQANTMPRTSFQTPGLGQQNSTPSGFDAILKAKSHSLMPPPVQNKFLGLSDNTQLQAQVNYLKAMSQSSMAAQSPMQPSMSFDVGARLQALRQMGASKQAGAQQRITIPDALRQSQSNLSQTRNAASIGLPKSYLDLIQGSGTFVGSASVPNRVPMPNLIQPELSAPAPSSVVAHLQQRLSSNGHYAKQQQWR
ncbi:unnamed protein product [Cylindrotheca closterium]|uniref:HSF-type DNA-binding domain-containing protein n=1 Tax=Cylindrotheca closterium TaxID=2856 RepID=A0AAD2FMP4_9STRA|nr:unnamed protein product [Cylindrotheca closterium]